MTSPARTPTDQGHPPPDPDPTPTTTTPPPTPDPPPTPPAPTPRTDPSAHPRSPTTRHPTRSPQRPDLPPPPGPGHASRWGTPTMPPPTRRAQRTTTVGGIGARQPASTGISIAARTAAVAPVRRGATYASFSPTNSSRQRSRRRRPSRQSRAHASDSDCRIRELGRPLRWTADRHEGSHHDRHHRASAA